MLTHFKTNRWSIVSPLGRSVILAGATALALAPLPAVANPDGPTPTYRLLMQDILINADLWSETPEILSASYGFEGIIGINGTKDAVIAADGAWQDLEGYENPPYRAQTSSGTPQGIAVNYGYPVYEADALPVVFSWPVLPSTVRAQDFLIHVTDGTTVTIVRPDVVSIVPNQEYNERNTLVMFGQFGNRLAPGTEGAVYPVKVEIAPDATLQLYGRIDGKNVAVSAAGLSKESGNPYAENGGPTLVGAKLSRMSTLGEGAPPGFDGQLPNDGVTLYGEEDAQFRLRVLTTGGFSADGVTSVMPDDFQKHFRLRLEDTDGSVIWLTEVGVEYQTVSLGSVIILGLADLGPPLSGYDPTYVEDHDNQIDIILKGDEAAMRLITHVEIPASGDYAPFYNPGGPGMDGTPGVTYTQPGPYTLQPVMMALDDPMTVTYQAVPEPSSIVLTGGAAALAIFGRRFLRRRRNA